MKNAFKLGAVALFLSASMVACKGSGSGAAADSEPGRERALQAEPAGQRDAGALLPDDGQDARRVQRGVADRA